MRASSIGRLLLCLAGLLASGCRQDMHDQPKYEPLEASEVFADGRSSRQPVVGTVARGLLLNDPIFETGRDADDLFVVDSPMPVDHDLLKRGRGRYDAYCSVCHGRTGDGLGMVVKRGFKQPTSFHEDRLRESPVGYFFDVMTNGFGQMSSYSAQLPPADRWAIAAYVKALQLSRHVPVDRLTEADQAALAAAAASEAGLPEEDEGHTP